MCLQGLLPRNQGRYLDAPALLCTHALRLLEQPTTTVWVQLGGM